MIGQSTITSILTSISTAASRLFNHAMAVPVTLPTNVEFDHIGVGGVMMVRDVVCKGWGYAMIAGIEQRASGVTSATLYYWTDDAMLQTRVWVESLGSAGKMRRMTSDEFNALQARIRSMVGIGVATATEAAAS